MSTSLSRIQSDPLTAASGGDDNASMGIQGLATFIRSRAGHTMRNLPLTELRDRRVCIDGNILTLQFHHSNESQHPNRTILGSVRHLYPSGRLVRAGAC